jgi:hypothetical protein
MYMFINNKKPISQFGLFEKPRILVEFGSIFSIYIFLQC